MEKYKSFVMNYGSRPEEKNGGDTVAQKEVEEPQKAGGAIEIAHYDDHTPISLTLPESLIKDDTQQANEYEDDENEKSSNTPLRAYPQSSEEYSDANAYFLAERENDPVYDDYAGAQEEYKEEATPAGDTAPEAGTAEDDDDNTREESHTDRAEEAVVTEPEDEKERDKKFKDDLWAIMEHQKDYQNYQEKAMPSKPGASPQENPGAENEDTGVKKTKNEHAIFDKIAQSMQMANTYDFGAIAMEKKFDTLEKETNTDFSKKIKELLDEQENDKEAKKPSYVNTEDEDKVLTEDFLDDIDMLNKLSAEKSKKTSEKFLNTQPLSPENGGFFVNTETLQPGDLILWSVNRTEDPVPGDKSKAENLSSAGVYLGEGIYLEAGKQGLKEQKLEEALKNHKATVGLRHRDINDEKAGAVAKKLKEDPGQKEAPGQGAIIRNLAVQVIDSYCTTLPADLAGKCRDFKGKVYLGTEGNNAFYCAKNILEAFDQAGLKLSDTQPQTSEELVQLDYNGALRYIGHLKI
ncbi:hypothetical protein [Sinomicrobium weinanense]|uniref:Uncharacterized protein n=1 Tax=Sinomicrobium weinanense TaxID=2842200 RepID=A0A926JPD9_9FLAO|nr:hypothetical protein [Sinomicrobium weinanense]MBC9794796.1 hypothetical protein [Sinomicrobium weinanense]MBU3125055.1 hypothetical protein [Sinomicrobium weinanense]